MNEEVLNHYGIEKIKINGRDSYRMKCDYCGQEMIRHQSMINRERICNYCRMKRKAQSKAIERSTDIRTTGEKRFQKAVDRITVLYPNEDYENSFRIAKSRSELYGSSHEAMIAIELIHQHFSIIPQQKLGNYKADFVIPKHKVIVEIDGEPFHGNKDRELKKELEMQLSLGLGWIVIHIPSKKVEASPKKSVEYIKELISGNQGTI